MELCKHTEGSVFILFYRPRHGTASVIEVCSSFGSVMNYVMDRDSDSSIISSGNDRWYLNPHGKTRRWIQKVDVTRFKYQQSK